MDREGTMITKIATAAVYVDDQQAAERFWTEQVGMELHRSQEMGPQARWLEVGPAGAASRLVIYPKSMMKDWAERKPSIVFECDDIQKTHAAMAARGVAFTEEPKEMPWGMFAIFRDPDGNEFVLKAG